MAGLEIIQPADALLNERARDLHRVQFYKEEPFLIQSVARHLAASLRDGGSAIALATKEHRGKILEELVKLEIPTETLLRRYIAHDAREALTQLMLNDAPDPSRFDATLRGILRLAQDQSGLAAPVAAFGEMVAVLWAEGKREAAVQLEQLWNEFTRRHPLSLLCAYPLSHFSSAEDQGLFARICAEHTSVVPSEGFAWLTRDDVKAREIAGLQQRAESLALEVEARKIAEARLQATQSELESLVEQRTSSLRRLSLQVLKLQDMERRRIARELHDSLGQEFVGLKVNLDLARRSPHDEELWKRCDSLLARCISEVRTLSYLLHPPMIEDAGFASAAEWYIEDFSRRSGMNISFSASGEISRLPDYAKLVLFRAMQEALLNIYRHARATAGEVRVQRCNGEVVLEVKDNGIGIPREKLARFNRNGTGMGVGLTGMRERVRDLKGMFELESGPEGTTLRLSVPLARRG